MKFLLRDIANTTVIVELEELQRRLPPGWRLIPPDPAEQEIITLDLRSDPRYLLFGEMEVCDVTNAICYSNARIKDISESGLSIEPVEALVNDVRKFLINPVFLDGVEPFELRAVCRWTNELQAGFEITGISPNSKKELQKFLKLFCYEDSNATTKSNTGGSDKSNSE